MYKVKTCKLSPNKKLVSDDVISLLTGVPVKQAVNIVTEWLQEDSTLDDRTGLSPKEIGNLL